MTPKTHHSVRLAALSTSLEHDLVAWREWNNHTSPEDWVFPSTTGKTPLSASNFWRRNIGPHLAPLRLEWVNFQVLRRSAASLMNALGVDGKLVADQARPHAGREPERTH